MPFQILKIPVTELNFKHFDVLNPNYSVMKFDEVAPRTVFRYKKTWFVKTSPSYAKIFINKADFNLDSQKIEPISVEIRTKNPFVFINKTQPKMFNY